MAETKTFWRTSEFWMTVGLEALGEVAKHSDQIPPQYGMVLQAIVGLGYTLSRGIAKAGVPPDVVVVTPPTVVTP